MNWKTPDIYPMGRAAEFALAAHAEYWDNDYTQVILGYITECEHQDGSEYWKQFPTLSAALEDFVLYIAAGENDD